MNALPERVDVAIVGAGTAGAAAALLCAERGLRTLCVDRGDIATAGAQWVNGVPESSFTIAGIDRPLGDELRGLGGPFHLIAGWGPRRIVIEDHGVLEVDMRHLVTRLQRRARERGATLAGDTIVRATEGETLITDRGNVQARWIVDASGLAGARLIEQPKVAGEHICAAAQRVHQITDMDGAARFFADIDTPLGQVACFTGVEGGFSIVNVRVEGDHVSILTGSIPALGHRSGKAMLDQFVAEQSWIGEPIFGGARAIPLRRPFDRIASGNVAAIGDAAAQVFPAHGSGIGAGMIAARVLADALAEGRGPEGYAADWQRRWGGLLASYDLFRRFSQTLSVPELQQMMEYGLMDPELARCGMAQEHPRPKLSSLPGKAVTLTRVPRLAGRLAKTLARMVAARALYARYPRDPGGLPRWSRQIARIFGDPPDPLRS